MKIWKLSIKPNANVGYDSFGLCRQKSIVGVGWSDVFADHNIATLEDSYDALRATTEKVPRPVERLMDEVKHGDLLWIHQGGSYYLCKISDEEKLLGPQIDTEFEKYDLAHARNAMWARVPEPLVSGSVQRCTIARRVIQQMRCSEAEKNLYDYLHRQLSGNKAWFPAELNESELSSIRKSLSGGSLEAMMSPDDHEDLVAGYLQHQGWILVKSTCFRSKPKFEFRMVKPGPLSALVQVKSGNVPLRPCDYQSHVNDSQVVCLYSTHKDPYPGKPIAGVKTLDPQEVLEWALENTWVLPTGLKIRLKAMQASGGS